VVFDPPLLVTVRFTVYIPTAVYVWVSFWRSLYVPSPNDQFHEVGEPVEVSVNVTASGTVPEVGVAVKEATGATVPPVTLM
jgi:hypothetical protein